MSERPPVYVDGSSGSLERRRHQRQKLSAVVYLDIGESNGGIVIDLSEEGAGVHAVGPLISQGDVILRIQLPDSQTRIETGAQIAWAGKSNRQVGLRFVAMPSEGRARIREWMRSQTPSSEVLPSVSEIAEPLGGREYVASRPRDDKWRSLLAEFESVEREIASRLGEDNGADALRDNEPVRESITGFRTPARTPSHSSGLGITPSNDVDPFSEAARDDAQQIAPNEQPPPFPGKSALAKPKERNTDNADLIHWPVPVSSAVPKAINAPSPSTPVPGAPIDGSGADSGGTVAAAGEVRAELVRPPSRGGLVWKWAGLASLFILLPVISFAIGKWAGFSGTRSPITQASKVPNVAEQTVAHRGFPNAVPNSKNGSAFASAHKVRIEKAESKSNLVPQSRAPAPQPQIPAAPSLSEGSASVPADQPVRVSQPEPSRSVPALADKPAPVVPAPITVAGRILGPSDRFNPAHLTYRFDPDYPPLAEQQRIEGIVELHLVIDADGNVRSVTLLSGSPLLAPAAMAAAQNWRYLPALLNGEPVETEQDAKIEFHLPR